MIPASARQARLAALDSPLSASALRAVQLPLGSGSAARLPLGHYFDLMPRTSRSLHDRRVIGTSLKHRPANGQHEVEAYRQRPLDPRSDSVPLAEEENPDHQFDIAAPAPSASALGQEPPPTAPALPRLDLVGDYVPSHPETSLVSIP